MMQEIAVNAILTKEEWETMPGGLFDQANLLILLYWMKKTSGTVLLFFFTIRFYITFRAPRYSKYSNASKIMFHNITTSTQIIQILICNITLSEHPDIFQILKFTISFLPKYSK